jgi:hypothetical protein
MSTPTFTKERSSSLQYVGAVNTANNTSTASLLAEENGVTNERQTRLDFTLVSISTTEAGTNGAYGAMKIYTFPAGTYGIIRNIVFNVNATPGSGGITDTATLKYSLGSAAEATDHTLDGTQITYLGSSNATAFVAGVGGGGAGGGAMTAVSNTAVAIDSRSAGLELFLNLGIVDAGSTANDTVTLNGSIWITWALLGA